MKNLRCWVLIQGRVFKPTLCQPVPPPPIDHGIGTIAGMIGRDVPDGTAYGPMTKGEALCFSSALHGYSTLCIMPGDGLQVVMLEGLAWHKANEAIGYQLPGMTFFPWNEDKSDSDGVSRIALIGYGESFADLLTEDATASCAPGIVFPVGRAYARPVRNRRSDERDINHERDWIAPDVKTLEEIAPVVECVRTLNLTDKDRADFRAAEILDAEEDNRLIRENMAWWAAKHAAGETVDLGNGVWGLKPDVQTNPNARKLLP